MSSDPGPFTGKVKFFDTDKGYGFLVPDDGGKDVFVHNLQVRRAGLKLLIPGEILSFTVSAARGRPEAMNLARVAGETAPSETTPEAVVPTPEVAAPPPEAPTAPAKAKARAPVPAPDMAVPAAARRPRTGKTLSLRNKKELESGGAKD